MFLGVPGMGGEQPRPPVPAFASTRLRGFCPQGRLPLRPSWESLGSHDLTCPSLPPSKMHTHVCTHVRHTAPTYACRHTQTLAPGPQLEAASWVRGFPLLLTCFPPVASSLSPWPRDGDAALIPTTACPPPAPVRNFPRQLVPAPVGSMALALVVDSATIQAWTLWPRPSSRRCPHALGPPNLAHPCPLSLQSPWLQGCFCVGLLGGNLVRHGLTASTGRPWLCPCPGQNRHSCQGPRVALEVGPVPAQSGPFSPVCLPTARCWQTHYAVTLCGGDHHLLLS